MNVDLKLSVLEPIHATWLVEMSRYNFFTSALGRPGSCLERMAERAGIKDVLTIREVFTVVRPRVHCFCYLFFC